MTDLGREFGISRKTGYKLAQRFEHDSAVGLLDQRRVPERIPHRTSAEVAELLVQLRERHPTWGPKKLRARFLTEHPAPLHDLVLKVHPAGHQSEDC
jgi:transposase